MDSPTTKLANMDGARSRSQTDTAVLHAKTMLNCISDTCNTEDLAPYRRRLFELFSLIDKEMQALYMENTLLKAKLEEDKTVSVGLDLPKSSRSIPLDESFQSFIGDIQHELPSHLSKQKKPQSRPQKWKTAFRGPSGKLAVLRPSGIASNLETSRHKLVQCFKAHNDVVWDVTAFQIGASGKHLVASASADQTAKIWIADEGSTISANYTGHSGSVNSISPLPDSSSKSSSQMLMLTSSGDRSSHIFKISSEDILKPVTHNENIQDDTHRALQIQQPNLKLVGHTDVVSFAQWLSSGDQIITASWDRTSNIFDAASGKIIKTLTGHDDRLTSCCTHPTQKLVATTSNDCTFRLWDFREAIQSVAVLQGHNDAVTSCVFSNQNHIISGSDDRTVKVWDLRNMRSPILAMRVNSSINKLSISPENLIAASQEDRISIYTLQGLRLARISKVGGKGHEKMVCSCAWLSGHSHLDLVSSGLDGQVIGWKLQLPASI